MSFRPMSDAEFALLEAKGRELFAAMVEGARSNEYVPVREVSRPDGGYHTSLSDAEDELDVNAEDELDVNAEDELDVNVTKIATDVGVPVDGYVSAEVWNAAGCKSQDHPPYLNFVHREGNAILSWYNVAEENLMVGGRAHWSDLMARALRPPRAPPHPAPPRAPFGTSPSPRRAMTGLLAIVRLTIVNITTCRLVDKIRKQYPDGEVMTWGVDGRARPYCLPPGRSRCRRRPRKPPGARETSPSKDLSHRAARRQRRSGRHERTI